MTTLWQDIRYGVRMLRKSPRFTAIAMITLAIGIGANAVMFSISDLLLFSGPKGVKNPEQLAYCASQGRSNDYLRYSEYLTIRDSEMAFSDVMAQIFVADSPTMVRGTMAWHVRAGYVSTNYFRVLGTAPILGRGFLPEEEQQSSRPVVVLSHRCWQRMGGDPNLVGEFIGVNGVACQIVGVAAEGFNGVTRVGFDVWLPAGSIRTVHSAYRSRLDREPSFYVVGRLKPDTTMSIAQTQLQAVVLRFRQENPENWPERSSINLRPPGREEISADDKGDQWYYGMISLILLAPSAIVLVIACLNLANMLIVQGTSRHREIAIRMALGGGRWRIVRQLLIESAMLVVLGGALGVLLAFCGSRVLTVYIASFQDEPSAIQVALNARVLAATLGVCLIAIPLFGLRPALLLSKRDIVGEVKASGGSVRGGLRRRRGSLSLAGQTALAVVLVLSAMLLTRSAQQRAAPDPRFPLTDKLVVEVDPIAAGYDEVQSVQACAALADHLALLPGVKAVGTSYKAFFGGGGFEAVGEYRPGTDEDGSGKTVGQNASFLSVGRDYFEAMEIPLLQGRRFDQYDHLPDAERVAIIDDSLARRLRPDGNALDCLIQWEYMGNHSDPYRVVGIVAHLPGIENREIHPQVYTAMEVTTWARCLCLHVENLRPADLVQQQIAQEVRRFDSRMPVLSVTTLAQKRYENSTVRLARIGARLAFGAAAAALFLAALGIYAIKGHMVASRTSEIGIRKALGATYGSIMGMVLREGLLVTTAGLIGGLLLGLAIAKIAARLLYGVSPLDPVSIVVTLMLLGVASLLASYLPARRAAKVDPMVALRCE